MLSANTGSGANVTFQLQFDNATGIGPTPSFATQQTFATGSGPQSAVIVDINNDGKADAVVTNGNEGTVSVLLNTTAPGATTLTFAARQTFATGSDPISVKVADINGDGKPDLVIANDGSNSLSVLLNTTTPGSSTFTFAAQQVFPMGVGPTSVSIADVNGDGKPDVIVTNLDDNNISLLLNTTAPGAATPTFAARQNFATGQASQRCRDRRYQRRRQIRRHRGERHRQHVLRSAQRHLAELRVSTDIRRRKLSDFRHDNRHQRRRQTRRDPDE